MATIRLADYTPPAYLVDTVDLDVAIFDDHTRVRARLAMRRASPETEGSPPLFLHGEDLSLVALTVDGVPLASTHFATSPEGLTIHAPLPASFVLGTECRIDPDANTQLSGLYRSKDGYFTQCEAEGFRRITYFLDRPDVMSRYTTRIEADAERFPILLSNGNPVEAGAVEGAAGAVATEDTRRHFARWEDPFPKPAYLFAMVAAKLEVLEDTFVTMSGRRVRCAVYVEPGKLDQCDHAMKALQLAMDWDERTFGREMDLDHYMIVAVSDFNMGAMENKGLNIFNTKFVLARPDTATDLDFHNIDRVVAHEYFHNWTGNRVTCRDWFQLSLKEGLTVYRDQEFGADVHSRGVTRIQEVRTLRTAQFPEDAGPMAHPIRPASYEEINNFYTPTVYEKGAEVVRMIATLVGKHGFRRGMDLYFERFDGMAVTCDDFVTAMADATGRDLAQFRRWYAQAGTPVLAVTSAWDASSARLVLTVSQRYPATAYERRLVAEGLPAPRAAYHLPLAIGLLDADGRELPLRLEGEAESRDASTSRVLEITEETQTFTFLDVATRPTPSLLRGYSAPVILEYDYTEAELAHLMAHDTDAFTRWEAGQRLSSLVLARGIRALGASDDAASWIPASYVDAMRVLLASAFTEGGDPAFVAEAMALPSEVVIAESIEGEVDPDAVHGARLALRRRLAAALQVEFAAAYARLASDAPYAPTSAQVGARALRNVCLGYLAELADVQEGATHGGASALALLETQFTTATNMTDAIAALSSLAQLEVPARETALEAFLAKWRHEALVVDKWLLVQSTSRASDTPRRVRSLLDHPAFDLKNPNKVYALVRAFCAANPKHFHAKDGSGYAFAADMVIALDAMNPQVASRIARSFDRWRRVDAPRRALARAALERIHATAGLSKDVAEVVGKALEAAAAS